MLPSKYTGCPRKKYLSEISGSQIHVTITGQLNKQICMKWSKKSITVQIIQMAQYSPLLGSKVVQNSHVDL